MVGIPVDPLFEVPVARGEARRKLGLSPDARVLLISAGGYGVGPVEHLVGDLLALKHTWQIVAIAGKSEKLKKSLEQLSRASGKLPAGGDRLVVVGFTKEMDQYMAAADVLYGVTMQEAGVSKRIAMRLEDYEEPVQRLAA